MVFFEGPYEGYLAHLQQLLTLNWHIDAKEWCEHGYIENTAPVFRLFNEWAAGDESTGDMRLFEVASGGREGFGTAPFPITYAKREDCDFFVTPAVAMRLEETLQQIAKLPRWIAPQVAA